MRWTYRLIKGKDRVYIGQAFYDRNGDIASYSPKPCALEGFDCYYGMSDDDTPLNVGEAAKDAVKELELMLKHIKERPAVIDPKTDITGNTE